jgi:cell wall-associated NlpC family hydrolase
VTARATGRHRAETTVSTPLTTMTAAIATKVPTASAARSGFVIAVSSGLVAGVGLPAQAADATSEGATTTASLKLPAIAPAADQVVVDQAVSAPATAKLRFERSAMSASLGKSAPDADSTAKAAETIASVSRSLTRAAFGQVAAQRQAAQQQAAQQQAAQQQAAKHRAEQKARAKLVKRTTHRVSRDAHRTNPPHKPKPVPVPAHSSRGGAAVAIAARYIGVPYRYGGSSPSGFDCSGLVLYVYKQLGVHLPRTSMAQYGATRQVSRSSARAGDLVFFWNGGRVTHVGIYAGGGMMIAAPHTGSRVQKQKIYSARVTYGRVG